MSDTTMYQIHELIKIIEGKTYYTELAYNLLHSGYKEQQQYIEKIKQLETALLKADEGLEFLEERLRGVLVKEPDRTMFWKTVKHRKEISQLVNEIKGRK